MFNVVFFSDFSEIFLTLQLSSYILEFLNFELFTAYLIVVGSDTVPL